MREKDASVSLMLESPFPSLIPILIDLLGLYIHFVLGSIVFTSVEVFVGVLADCFVETLEKVFWTKINAEVDVLEKACNLRRFSLRPQ